tara:strand:- start:10009 stop:11004 length:996 start_codon:yes stop_codon:yes gene_type:complete
MAFNVTSQITGQNISSTTSYCYMYEPLKVNAVETNSDVTIIKVDLIIHDTATGVLIFNLPNYATFDAVQNVSIEIDLTKIMHQFHNANTFKIGTVSDVSTATNVPVSNYKYSFQIYSDSNGTAVRTTKKLPIIGGRTFYDFSASVLQSQVLTEAQLYGVTLSGRWKNYPNIVVTLASPTATNSSPTITVTTESSSQYEPCGGMLIWKSRYGGWMYWGMDISTLVPTSSYGENLKVGMFEANAQGNPYVEVDYTKIDTDYNISLKALALTSDELKAVSGLSSAVVAYYMATPTSKLELMRVQSSSAPISTLISGGDFSVGLKSISTTSQNAR